MFAPFSTALKREQVVAEVRENLPDLPPECSRAFDDEEGGPRKS